MTYNFTATQVLDKVRELAAGNPEFVYGFGADFDECSYTSAGIVHHDGDEDTVEYIDGPACIVGQALSSLGVPLDELREEDTGNSASSIVPLFATDRTLDQDTLNTLDLIQSNQDRGVPWGETVK